MDLQNLCQLTKEEFDRRNLKSNVRYKALEKIISFLSQKYGNDLKCFQNSKDVLKNEYEKDKGKPLNCAESSAFNELFNQIQKVTK
ncbi:MAG: hypothetical protein IKO90_07270 [Bacteroidales bacterium]|nr:hypothetical protein [Bacteroidales bacterium]